MTNKQPETDTKGKDEKSKDQKLQDMIGAVVDKAFEAAKVMTKAGIKGAFVAKDLSDQVESGDAERAIKHGAAEAEKIVKAAARVAKIHFSDFLNELLSEKKNPDGKKKA